MFRPRLSGLFCALKCEAAHSMGSNAEGEVKAHVDVDGREKTSHADGGSGASACPGPGNGRPGRPAGCAGGKQKAGWKAGREAIGGKTGNSPGGKRKKARPFFGPGGAGPGVEGTLGKRTIRKEKPRRSPWLCGPRGFLLSPGGVSAQTAGSHIRSHCHPRIRQCPPWSIGGPGYCRGGPESS